MELAAEVAMTPMSKASSEILRRFLQNEHQAPAHTHDIKRKHDAPIKHDDDPGGEAILKVCLILLIFRPSM
jgi:hypothetical protein